MDRKWFQYGLAFLDVVLVKGVVWAGAAILVVQIVLWLWNGEWRDWSIKALFNLSEPVVAASRFPCPPWVLSKFLWFFACLPLFLFVPLAGWGAVGLFYLAALLVVSVLVQMSALFRQVFFRKRTTPPKHIAICIDGTWNYPENMADGVINGTNVYKFFDLLEGQRKHHMEIFLGANRIKKHVEPVVRDGKTKEEVKQLGLYYNGVGNRAEHTQLGIVVGGAFGFGARRIVRRAYRDLIRFYRDGDSISICGFSRGAAVARLLAAEVGRRGLPRYAFSDLPLIRPIALWFAKNLGSLRRPDIDLLGVWDTVASFGISKNILGIPFQRINLFSDLTVGETVKKAVHMLALDEQRDAFVPTLMTPSTDSNRIVQEVWFVGNHSNVGGGYADNTLSNVPLRYLCQEAKLFKQQAALPLLKFRCKESLLEQDKQRVEDRNKKLAELEKKMAQSGRQAPRPEELAFYGFGQEGELTPILYPDNNDYEQRIEIELKHDVRREASPIYENAPRFVPAHAVLDDSVRYKIVNFSDYEPESVMLYHKRRKALGQAELDVRRALYEGGHITKENLDNDEATIPELTSLRFAFTRASWLPEMAGASADAEA